MNVPSKSIEQADGWRERKQKYCPNTLKIRHSSALLLWTKEIEKKIIQNPHEKWKETKKIFLFKICEWFFDVFKSVYSRRKFVSFHMISFFFSLNVFHILHIYFQLGSHLLLLSLIFGSRTVFFSSFSLFFSSLYSLRLPHSVSIYILVDDVNEWTAKRKE